QAEDGIRDKLVTGVQTCALPIYRSAAFCWLGPSPARWLEGRCHSPRESGRRPIFVEAAPGLLRLRIRHRKRLPEKYDFAEACAEPAWLSTLTLQRATLDS